jgi:predicted nucleic acid-binding protein
LKRILLDTNVVLDLFLYRQPFVADALPIWHAHKQNQIEVYVSGITVVNLFYFARKANGQALARQAVDELLLAVKVCGTSHALFQRASQLPIADFEDAAQVAAALAEGLDAIVTRNIKDFKNSPVPVHLPADFVAHLNQP